MLTNESLLVRAAVTFARNLLSPRRQYVIFVKKRGSIGSHSYELNDNLTH